MKSFLIGIFFLGALMAGIAVAQNNGAAASQSPSAPQTSTPTPSQTPAAAPETEPQTQTPQAGASQNPAGAVTRVAPGSVIPVQLTKNIDAKKVKPGDEVVALVTEDMKTNSGMVLVPKDTKVVGHVTEAQPRSKDQKESEVGIAFDRALIKNGSEMQMPMSIQAVIAPPNSNSSAASGNTDQQPSGMGGSATPSASGGRMGSGAPSPSTPAPNMPSAEGTSADAQTGAAKGGISTKTQGVVGISNLKLMTTSAGSTQGSLLTSEKNNVKLESGTFMLLRVN
jgi:hypothetical protein